MSIERCDYCDTHIDLDFDSEHFEYKDDGSKMCINEQMDKEVDLLILPEGNNE